MRCLTQFRFHPLYLRSFSKAYESCWDCRYLKHSGLRLVGAASGRCRNWVETSPPRELRTEQWYWAAFAVVVVAAAAAEEAGSGATANRRRGAFGARRCRIPGGKICHCKLEPSGSKVHGTRAVDLLTRPWITSFIDVGCRDDDEWVTFIHLRSLLVDSTFLVLQAVCFETSSCNKFWKPSHFSNKSITT